jgi:flagellar basal body rod protein FlgB
MDENKVVGQRSSWSYKIQSAFTKPAYGGENMNLPATITDNLTELLFKIIEFTRNRHKILIQNINLMHSAGFTPKDMPVDEFSKLMQQAVSEYANSQRLVFIDSQNVKFGSNGSFKALPVSDNQAKQLLDSDRDEYLRIQVNKLLENSLNQRIAAELLKHKQDDVCLGRSFN